MKQSLSSGLSGLGNSSSIHCNSFSSSQLSISLVVSSFAAEFARLTGGPGSFCVGFCSEAELMVVSRMMGFKEHGLVCCVNRLARQDRLTQRIIITNAPTQRNNHNKCTY